jgi:hypothetical protein
MSAFLDAILKQTTEYRNGRVPQSDLDTLKKYFDVETSLALTQKYKDVSVVTLDKTTVYRAIDNGGNLGDAYNFIGKPNQFLGKVYGVVKVLGSGTFILLDAIKEGKIRIMLLSQVAAKPSNTPYVPPVPIPVGPTEDKTITPPSGGGGDGDKKMIMMVAGAALVLYILMKK